MKHLFIALILLGTTAPQVISEGDDDKEHNLGPIWIEVYNNTETGWQYGFHASPYPNIPLAQQESHGCLRMNYTDLVEFSNSLQLLDKFYSL